MNVDLTTLAENTYQSPSAPGQGEHSRSQSECSSRNQAVLAGAWRGAKFGGKWMAFIITALAIIMWVFIFAMLLYRWLWEGIDFQYILRQDGQLILKLFGLTIIVIALTTFWAAAISALIMGVGAGVSYKRSNKTPKRQS